MKYLISFSLYLLSFSQINAQIPRTCDLLDTLLTLKPVRKVLYLDETFNRNIRIRFIDTSRTFEGCPVGLDGKVINHVPIDLNSGYYRDIVLFISNCETDDKCVNVHLYICNFKCIYGYQNNRVVITATYQTQNKPYKLVKWTANEWDE